MPEGFLDAYVKGKEEARCSPPQSRPTRKNPRYLNCVENGLGLREWLKSLGHTYIANADKDGPNSGAGLC